MTADIGLAHLIQPLYGVPCWSAKRGYGFSLTFEFGPPRLEIREPQPYTGDSPRLRRLLSRRSVAVLGDWHLWTKGDIWTIARNGRLQADSEASNRRIDAALLYLDGQALTGLSVEPDTGRSVFRFDLSGSLEVACSEPGDEVWALWDPSGRVLAVRADGRFCHAPETTAPNQLEWLPLTAVMTDSRATANDEKHSVISSEP